MKFIAIVVLGASVGAAVYLYLNGRRPQLEAPGTEDAGGQYSCPMHPDVVSPKPGACPKCGMALLASKSTAAVAADSCTGSTPAGPGCCGARSPTPVEILAQLPQGHPPIPNRKMDNAPGHQPDPCGVPGLSPL